MDDFKKRLINLSVVSFIIILILGSLFFYFRVDIIKRVTKINEVKKELVARDEILNRIHELEQEEVLSLVYLNQLRNALPTESEMVHFEEVLQDLANKNNLILSFRFGSLNEAKGSEPKSYNFNLILSGSVFSISKWLTELKNLVYQTQLEQIELTQTTIEGNYDVKILGRVYLR
ncbi:MAG: hypothetical protein PHH35_02800 [Candidatus Pacebacteria bacterium]|jgi:hypothetical protein|nr:hypothetical protein [Candidatus Paceibacterota bacterium]